MTPSQAIKRYVKAQKGFRNRALVRLQDVNLQALQEEIGMKKPVTASAAEINDLLTRDPPLTLADAAEVLKREAKRRSKFGNRKVVKNGERFDSVKEYERHLVLLDMQKRGEIRRLQRQPCFRLFVHDKLICTYVADWRYDMLDKDGTLIDVAEDCKGFQTKDWKIKWALAKALNPHIEWRLS